MGIKILHTADWHLHHSRVSTTDTVDGLYQLLFPRIKDVDLMVIAGDMFDNSVSMNDASASQIVEVFIDMLNECAKYGTVLRILQGTYLHDRNQLKMLDRIYAKYDINVDYGWTNNVYVERIDKLNIHVLYLPDNLPYKHKSEVLAKVKDLMRIHDITKVDYAFVHGEFDFSGYSKFVTDAYTVKDFKMCNRVLAGHIHSPMHCKHVYYAGSFNRLSHNEEHPKGYWIHDGYTSEFIENTLATMFITKDISEYTNLDDIVKIVDDVVSGYPAGKAGHLRLITSDVHIRQAISNYCRKHYPNIILKLKSPKSNNSITKSTNEPSERLEVPTNRNITQIVCNHIRNVNGIDMDYDIAESIILGEIYGNDIR